MTAANWIAFASIAIPAIPAMWALVIGLRNAKTAKDAATTAREASNRSASLEEFDKLRIALRDELDKEVLRADKLRADLDRALGGLETAMARIGKLEDAVADERAMRQQADERARLSELRATHAEARVSQAEDKARIADERASRAEGRVAMLQTRVQKLEDALRLRGGDPDSVQL